MRKAFASVVAGLSAVTILAGGCAPRQPDAVSEEMQVRNCIVTANSSPALEDSGRGRLGVSEYDFNRGQVRDGIGNQGWSMSFRDMYTESAQIEVLRAYEATKTAGKKCPAPQFAPGS